jgi:predicted permease
MTAVINKLTEMVIMIIIGYICAKVQLTGPDFNRHTSKVLTNVLLPATILKAMTGLGGDISNGELVYVIFLFFIMMGLPWIAGILLAKILPIDKNDRGILIGVVMYMNISFVGFPLVETYYGAEGMLYACLSCVPMNLLMFSVGVAGISGNNRDAFSLKGMLNLPLISTILGIVIMLMELRLPAVISSTINSVASATVPISMIILGSSLAAIPTKSAFGDIKIYIIAVVRLLICPFLTNLLLRLFVEDAMLIGVVTILAATPVAVLMTPLSVQYGKSDVLPSKSIFISTVLSIITMPTVIWLLL